MKSRIKEGGDMVDSEQEGEEWWDMKPRNDRTKKCSIGGAHTSAMVGKKEGGGLKGSHESKKGKKRKKQDLYSHKGQEKTNQPPWGGWCTIGGKKG